MNIRSPQYDLTVTPKTVKPKKVHPLHKIKPYISPPKTLINTSKSGAASELIVCADLILKGFDVFRAVSPSCPCDLVIIQSGTLRRVEVRTGTRRKDGKVIFPLNKADDRHDIYAVVIRAEREVTYIPDL